MSAISVTYAEGKDGERARNGKLVSWTSFSQQHDRTAWKRDWDPLFSENTVIHNGIARVIDRASKQSIDWTVYQKDTHHQFSKYKNRALR